MGMSGIDLKIKAKSNVITTKEKMKFIESKRILGMGSELPANVSPADIAAVTSSDVSNSVPVVTTKPSDQSRSLIVTFQKVFEPLFSFQIKLKALRSSTKAPDTQISIAKIANVVAKTPSTGLFML